MVGTKRKTKPKIEREGRYGRFKSRSKKIKYVRTPGARTKVQYKKKRLSKAACASCGAALAGVPNKEKAALKKIPRSGRRPDRPYGGNLCSKCMRKTIIAKARS